MKQPDERVFFIDRCLGKHLIAERLRAAGQSVEIHDEHFPPDCSDEQWLAVAGSKSWLVITKDKNFQKRPVEILSIARSRAQVFQLSTGEMTGAEMAELLVKRSKQIKDFARGNRAPLIARVNRSGKIQIAVPASRLLKLTKN